MKCHGEGVEQQRRSTIPNLMNQEVGDEAAVSCKRGDSKQGEYGTRLAFCGNRSGQEIFQSIEDDKSQQGCEIDGLLRKKRPATPGTGREPCLSFGNLRQEVDENCRNRNPSRDGNPPPTV